MRTFIKLGSLALTAGLTLAFGCGSDDSDSDDTGTDAGGSGSGGDGSGGSTTDAGGSGGDGAGGSTTGAGGSTTGAGGSTTGSGGSAGMGEGGTAGETPIDEAPYANAACTEDGGPTAAVTGSGVGAFADEADWLAGWTNFSTDSSGVDCSGTLTPLPTEADGTFTDAETTLTAADSPYLLDIKTYVADGQALTVEPGVVFCASGDGSLIVSRGGTIDAEGTADEPIVFTSLSDEGEKIKGEWGGVILLGNGRTFKGEDVIMEGLSDNENSLYGGTDDAESSGTLAYVRIEFGGTELNPGNEINGLTMGGVGSGTTIHHIQVNTSLDDCFEWFGGMVNADHLVCYNTGDDMFDADSGYRGTLDTLLGIAIVPLTEDPNGFEMDSDVAEAEPVTDITASNVTLCGTGEDYEGGLAYGMVLREYVHGTFSNLVVSGFEAGIDARDAFVTDDEPHVTITNSTLFEGVVHTVAYEESDCTDSADPECDDDQGFDERTWFEDGEGNTFFE